MKFFIISITTLIISCTAFAMPDFYTAKQIPVKFFTLPSYTQVQLLETYSKYTHMIAIEMNSNTMRKGEEYSSWFFKLNNYAFSFLSELISSTYAYNPTLDFSKICPRPAGWMSLRGKGKSCPVASSWHVKQEMGRMGLPAYGPNCGGNYTRCNTSQFGPGPTKEEFNSNRLPDNIKGLIKFPKKSTDGICVETRKAETGCSKVRDALKDLRGGYWMEKDRFGHYLFNDQELGEKNVNDFIEKSQHDFLNHVQFLNSFCSDYVAKTSDANVKNLIKFCESMNRDVEQIMITSAMQELTNNLNSDLSPNGNPDSQCQKLELFGLATPDNRRCFQAYDQNSTYSYIHNKKNRVNSYFDNWSTPDHAKTVLIDKLEEEGAPKSKERELLSQILDSPSPSETTITEEKNRLKDRMQQWRNKFSQFSEDLSSKGIKTIFTDSVTVSESEIKKSSETIHAKLKELKATSSLYNSEDVRDLILIEKYGPIAVFAHNYKDKLKKEKRTITPITSNTNLQNRTELERFIGDTYRDIEEDKKGAFATFFQTSGIKESVLNEMNQTKENALAKGQPISSEQIAKIVAKVDDKKTRPENWQEDTGLPLLVKKHLQKVNDLIVLNKRIEKDTAFRIDEAIRKRQAGDTDERMFAIRPQDKGKFIDQAIGRCNQGLVDTF